MRQLLLLQVKLVIDNSDPADAYRCTRLLPVPLLGSSYWPPCWPGLALCSCPALQIVMLLQAGEGLERGVGNGADAYRDVTLQILCQRH